MANTPVLNLETADTTSAPPHYTVRVEDDRIENANKDKVDAFCGHVSASFCETFYVSGSIAGHLGSGSGSLVAGSEFYGGLRYAPRSRIITEIIAYQRMSGSNGVTVVNALTGSKNNVFGSIFSNLVFKPTLSASAGDFTVGSTKTFSDNRWPAGKMLGVALDSVTAAGADLTVQVFWKPSASYGA